MSGLSEKKKKEFIEAFSLFDKDGDKKISEEELANVSVLFSESVASRPGAHKLISFTGLQRSWRCPKFSPD